MAGDASSSSSRNFQMPPPCFCPASFLGFTPLEKEEHGPGIYAVPMISHTSPFIGIPSRDLFPLTYDLPAQGEAGVQGGGEINEQQREGGQPPELAAQRQVVLLRRFHLAFQLDLLLILKLAVVIFLFHQDGSRQRLIILVFSASVVYLYQIGALAPLLQWISHYIRRATTPTRPRNVVAPDDERLINGSAEVAGGSDDDNIREDGGEQNGELLGRRNNHLWEILKEIQMIICGFLTSLLPGFHNHID